MESGLYFLFLSTAFWAPRQAFKASQPMCTISSLSFLQTPMLYIPRSTQDTSRKRRLSMLGMISAIGESFQGCSADVAKTFEGFVPMNQHILTSYFLGTAWEESLLPKLYYFLLILVRVRKGSAIASWEPSILTVHSWACILALSSVELVASSGIHLNPLDLDLQT